MKDYDVKVYRGWPETSGDTLEEMVEKGFLEPVEEDKEKGWILCPGVYSCHITGAGIYPTLKVISVSESQSPLNLRSLLDDSVVSFKQKDGVPEGYQPTVVVPDPPDYFKRTQKDELLCIWPNEILDIYADAAVPDHHQCRKQEELESVLRKLESRVPQMHLFSFGISEHYQFAIPMAILTKTSLDDCDCWEDALDTLRKDTKINIWYQAQIHGNEPAACDGALAVLDAFSEDEALYSLLDCVNLVIIPRANPEAAYLYRRMTYSHIDLNRDHMACEAYETRLLHRAFQILEPEVVLDGHEFTFFVTENEAGRGYVKKGCEIMSSPATSLNIEETVRCCSYEICGRVFAELQEKGYGIYHFGTAEKCSFGRSFYGIHQCLSFLIETRGIGGGRYGYEKRVKAQRDAILAYIRHVAASGEYIKDTVAHARKQDYSNFGIVLQHGSSENVFTPYKGVNQQYYLDGSLRDRIEEGLLLKDLPLRVRRAAKGYVIPADVEHVEDILTKIKDMGCLWEFLEPGTCVPAEQYQYAGLQGADVHEKDITAELLTANDVIFDRGAYLISADDFRIVPLAMLMEPDVTDMVGTKGSLFQQGYINYEEETGLFPLYRMTGL